MRCGRCENFLRDSIPALSHLSYIKETLHPKRWRKHSHGMAPFLTEVLRIVPQREYMCVRTQIFNHYKQTYPEKTHLHQGIVLEEDAINLFFNLHTLLKTFLPEYKSVSDQAYVFLADHCFLKGRNERIKFDILFMSCLEYTMQVYNDVHLGSGHAT